MDSTAEQNINFYAPKKAQVYELSPGQYWLKGVNLDGLDLADTDSVLLSLPIKADSFRVRAAMRGRDVLVQQRTAARRWRTQLRLSLAAATDSLLLARKGLPRPEELPQPLVLQARTGRLRLRLFITSLSRQQFGFDTTYRYAANGWLLIRP
jgi:hypothetical protein